MNPLRHVLLALVVLLFATACGDASEDAEVSTDLDVLPDPFPIPDPSMFPVGDPVDILESFAHQTCTSYCVHMEMCGQEGDCLDDCLTLVETDQGLAEAYCAIHSACGSQSRCEGGDFANNRECRLLCDSVSDCGGFPSDIFGPVEVSCIQGCSGYVQAKPEASESEMACYSELMETCQLDNVGQCQLDLGDDDMCSTMCGELIDSCNGIPGPVFVTVQDCLDTCRTAPVTTQLTMNTCVSTAGCDIYERCFPPLETEPEGCPAFCTALDDKCPGAIAPAACPAFCTGVKQALPGADLPGAAECINDAPECPGDDTFVCLLPDFDGCDDICAALDVCGANVDDCDTGCALIAARDPDIMPALHTCVLDNECNTLGVCFQ